MTTISSKYRGTREFLLVYARLINAAESSDFVGYGDVARILRIQHPGNHMGREVGEILGEISEDEYEHARPLLSAVAVGTAGIPGDGFWSLARQLGRLATTNQEEEIRFWRAELGRSSSRLR